MSKSYRARRRLRFAHCDPAGIAYYPRYFELCDSVIEDWTEEVIGVPRRTLHLDMGMAIPTVDLYAQFTSVSRLGDWLDFDLDLLAVGTSSADLRLGASCEGEARFEVGCRIVLVRGAPIQSVPWPAEWKARLESVTVGGEVK